MKRTLALFAAAFIAAAPFAAMAEDHAAPAADAPAAEAPAAVEHTLTDGTKIVVEGDMVSIMGADGSKTPAPDGEHMLSDGTTLKTMGGKVVPAAPAEGEAAPAEGAAH